MISGSQVRLPALTDVLKQKSRNLVSPLTYLTFSLQINLVAMT